jgi:hypothetical protein
MTAFVWTKMGVESGETLPQIIQRKEAERIAGDGNFWWGIGTSLGAAVRDDGSLAVLFHQHDRKSPCMNFDTSHMVVFELGQRGRNRMAVDAREVWAAFAVVRTAERPGVCRKFHPAMV